jgi:hypothetical protein
MTSWDHSVATTMTMLTKMCPARVLDPFMALDPFKLLYESNMGTGGLMGGKVEELLFIGDRPFCFVVIFVMLVVPITPSIKLGMYIVYLGILFYWNQIILPKLEQG